MLFPEDQDLQPWEEPPETAAVLRFAPAGLRFQRGTAEGEDDLEVLETYFNEKLICRGRVAPEWLDLLSGSALEGDFSALLLAAREQDPGIQARLCLLIPEDVAQATLFKDEPWKQQATQDDDEKLVPLLLGTIIRFRQDRVAPDDLHQEAEDLLSALLSKGGQNPIDKMLGSL